MLQGEILLLLTLLGPGEPRPSTIDESVAVPRPWASQDALERRALQATLASDLLEACQNSRRAFEGRLAEVRREYRASDLIWAYVDLKGRAGRNGKLLRCASELLKAAEALPGDDDTIEVTARLEEFPKRWFGCGVIAWGIAGRYTLLKGPRGFPEEFYVVHFCPDFAIMSESRRRPAGPHLRFAKNEVHRLSLSHHRKYMPDVVVGQFDEGIARYWAVRVNLVSSNEEATADALKNEKWLEGLLTGE